MGKININDFAVLKNDYPCDIRVGNTIYPSVEHAYQAAKFSDSKIKEKIANATIADAKKIGRRTSGIVENWDEIKTDIMRYLLRNKFCNFTSSLAQTLIDTGSSDIIFNSKDLFWGTGSENDSDPALRSGNNVLGMLLEETRTELQFMVGWESGKSKDTRLVDALSDGNFELANACQDLYNTIRDWSDGKLIGDLDEAIGDDLYKIDNILDDLSDEG